MKNSVLAALLVGWNHGPGRQSLTNFQKHPTGTRKKEEERDPPLLVIVSTPTVMDRLPLFLGKSSFQPIEGVGCLALRRILEL